MLGFCLTVTENAVKTKWPIIFSVSDDNINKYRGTISCGRGNQAWKRGVLEGVGVSKKFIPKRCVLLRQFK